MGKLARNVTQVLGSGRRRQTNDSERFWLEGKGVSACVLVRTLLFAPFSSARRLFSSLPFAHCVSNKATGGLTNSSFCLPIGMSSVRFPVSRMRVQRCAFTRSVRVVYGVPVHTVKNTRMRDFAHALCNVSEMRRNRGRKIKP